MYEITIKGNTPAELFANLAQMAAANANTAPAPTAPIAQPPVTAPAAAATVPSVAPVPVAPPVPAAAPVPVSAATPVPAVPTVPTAAPTYTLDALARAGAALAQSGKMQEAVAVLAKYGVQTVNQLKPEQYGAVAAELRALGAQI